MWAVHQNCLSFSLCVCIASCFLRSPAHTAGLMKPHIVQPRLRNQQSNQTSNRVYWHGSKVHVIVLTVNREKTRLSENNGQRHRQKKETPVFFTHSLRNQSNILTLTNLPVLATQTLKHARTQTYTHTNTSAACREPLQAAGSDVMEI